VLALLMVVVTWIRDIDKLPLQVEHFRVAAVLDFTMTLVVSFLRLLAAQDLGDMHNLCFTPDS